MRGLDAVDATIAAVQSQFPGVPLYPVGGADAHHDVVRFRWGLRQAGEEPIVIGRRHRCVRRDGRAWADQLRRLWLAARWRPDLPMTAHA